MSIRELRRQAFARRICPEPCAALPPFRVEPFGGGLIDQANPPNSNQKHVTDLHIVDAKGRTVYVLPYHTASYSRARLAKRAEQIALGLNEVYW